MDRYFGTCLIYNFAQHYRLGIFKRLDKEGCDFYFGNSAEDIAQLDYSLLNNFREELRNLKIISVFYWQKGSVRLLFNRKYTKYIILGEYYCLSTWVILLLNQFLKKKIYLWTHGYYGNEGFLKQIVKDFFFKLSDGLLLYGDYARNIAISRGLNADKLHVINNSLDFEKQSSVREGLSSSDIYKRYFRNELPNVIFIGRLTSRKRLELLLEMQQYINSSGKGCNIILVGDGDQATKLRELVVKLDIQENVWFYGECYDEKIIGELIFNADVCVSPGNIGLTAMHVLTYGTPAITHGTFKSQMPEFESIVPGITGDFFEEDDLKSLVFKVNNWLKTNSKHRDRVRENCIEKIAQEYNAEFQIKVLNEIFLEI